LKDLKPHEPPNARRDLESMNEYRRRHRGPPTATTVHQKSRAHRTSPGRRKKNNTFLLESLKTAAPRWIHQPSRSPLPSCRPRSERQAPRSTASQQQTPWLERILALEPHLQPPVQISLPVLTQPENTASSRGRSRENKIQRWLRLRPHDAAARKPAHLPLSQRRDETACIQASRSINDEQQNLTVGDGSGTYSPPPSPPPESKRRTEENYTARLANYPTVHRSTRPDRRPLFPRRWRSRPEKRTTRIWPAEEKSPF